VAGFTADVGRPRLWARLSPELGPLSLKQAQGRISASEVLGGDEDGVPTLGAFGHAIALSDFSMETDDGLILPPATIRETHIAANEKNLNALRYCFWKQIEFFHYIVDALDAKTDSNATHILPAKHFGEVVVTTATGYASYFYIIAFCFPDNAGVIIEPSGKCYIENNIRLRMSDYKTQFINSFSSNFNGRKCGL